MHGRGRETFSNGECFIVYYKNGYKLEALASKSQSPNVIITHHGKEEVNKIADRNTGSGGLALPMMLRKESKVQSTHNSN